MNFILALLQKTTKNRKQAVYRLNCQVWAALQVTAWINTFFAHHLYQVNGRKNAGICISFYIYGYFLIKKDTFPACQSDSLRFFYGEVTAAALFKLCYIQHNSCVILYILGMLLEKYLLFAFKKDRRIIIVDLHL